MAFQVLAGVTLITDPKVLAIPIHENHEAWVNLRTKNTIVLGPNIGIGHMVIVIGHSCKATIKPSMVMLINHTKR